jgi:hypothetical protein
MNRVASVGRAAVAVALLLCSFAYEASAQAGSIISGKVTNEAGAPLSGANVFIQSLNVSAQSNASGNYTLVVPASARGQATLSARYIGYLRMNRTITISGSQTQDFSLKADPFKLEEVIVTGVANATSSATVPFSVG